MSASEGEHAERDPFTARCGPVGHAQGSAAVPTSLLGRSNVEVWEEEGQGAPQNEAGMLGPSRMVRGINTVIVGQGLFGKNKQETKQENPTQHY